MIEKDQIFGALEFSASCREVRTQNGDGLVSEEIKGRTHDLKSKGQGCMIRVSIPTSVPLKEFDYSAEVRLINPVTDTVVTAAFRGADVDWCARADDLVLEGQTKPHQEYRREAFEDEK